MKNFKSLSIMKCIPLVRQYGIIMPRESLMKVFLFS